MLTVQDFVATYQSYTDEELYTVYANADNYSEDAHKAVNIVIDSKGGYGALVKRLEDKAIIAKEKKRIAKEATKFGMEGIDASFLQNTTGSSILSKEEVNDIIETSTAIAAAIVHDEKVNSATVAKSLVGCGLATLLGGAFTTLQFVYFGATSYVLIIGLALISYFTVKLVTKKSYNNIAVLLASVLAFVLSWLVGYGVFLMVGFLG